MTDIRKNLNSILKNIVVLTLWMGIFSPCQAAIHYVDSGAAGDGSSWENAFTSVNQALAVADAGDSIWVAAGEYTPTGQNGDRTVTFELISGVALYGGFAGDETKLGERQPSINLTILSGDLGANDGPDFSNNGDNAFHVVTGNGVDSTAILDGFIIAGGNANGAAPDDSGGGLFIDNSSPMVVNCRVTGNTAAANGGGVYNKSSSPSLINILITGNAAEDGGGLFNENNSMPSIINCTITENTATDSGGGMFNLINASPSVVNCILWGNTASSFPQIANISSSPTISYSDIQGSGGSASWDAALGADGGGNIDVDPEFLNPEARDFRLCASAVVDAGNSDALPINVVTDLGGNTRLVDDADTTDTGLPRQASGPIVDMGAYERPAGAQQIIYVNAAQTDNAETGLSWPEAFTDLQAALTAAGSCSVEIRVASGIYLPGDSRVDAFQLRNGVTIMGGFAGDEAPTESPNPVQNASILSGVHC